MFGVIEPEFCAALARVMMLGALLEDRLWTLLTQLKMPAIGDMIFDGPEKNVVYQSDYAGCNVTTIIKKIREALQALSPEYQHHITAGQKLMDDADDAFCERNNHVHNVWNRPTLANGWGHRGINRRNRERLKKDAHEFEHGFAVTRETFVTVIANLIDVYERERRFEDMVKMPEFPIAE